MKHQQIEKFNNLKREFSFTSAKTITLQKENDALLQKLAMGSLQIQDSVDTIKELVIKFI